MSSLELGRRKERTKEIIHTEPEGDGRGKVQVSPADKRGKKASSPGNEWAKVRQKAKIGRSLSGFENVLQTSVNLRGVA